MAADADSGWGGTVSLFRLFQRPVVGADPDQLILPARLVERAGFDRRLVEAAREVRLLVNNERRQVRLARVFAVTRVSARQAARPG